MEEISGLKRHDCSVDKSSCIIVIHRRVQESLLYDSHSTYKLIAYCFGLPLAFNGPRLKRARLLAPSRFGKSYMLTCR